MTPRLPCIMMRVLDNEALTGLRDLKISLISSSVRRRVSTKKK